jgi:CheY-like chemotaxis protein
LVPIHDALALAGLAGPVADVAKPPQSTLQFAHDRVQQAAYGLLSGERRQALHHAIGRRLLDLAGKNLDEHLFEIVDQLNHPIQQRQSQGHRVLIVDDNVDGAEMIGEFLDLHGYHTAIAHDGPDARRIAAEFSPQIALLDIGLPVMDGYELATRLRDQWPEVKLVAITGYGQESDRERAHRTGFDAHLTKPVSVDFLAKLVERLTGTGQRTKPPA